MKIQICFKYEHETLKQVIDLGSPGVGFFSKVNNPTTVTEEIYKKGFFETKVENETVFIPASNIQYIKVCK